MQSALTACTFYKRRSNSAGGAGWFAVRTSVGLRDGQSRTLFGNHVEPFGIQEIGNSLKVGLLNQEVKFGTSGFTSATFETNWNICVEALLSYFAHIIHSPLHRWYKSSVCQLLFRFVFRHRTKVSQF